MANYCANVVTFSGELAGLLRLQPLFAQAEYGKAFRPAMLPEDDDSSYFFDASLQDNKLFYETRWVPNLQDVLRLAEQLGVDYVHQYDECSNMVYSEASRKNGEFEHVWLDFIDIAGHEFGSWEDLLQKKSAGSQKRRRCSAPAVLLPLKKWKRPTARCLPATCLSNWPGTRTFRKPKPYSTAGTRKPSA